MNRKKPAKRKILKKQKRSRATKNVAALMTRTHETTAFKLRQSELQYRRLFEAAQDGILILDEVTGRITDANPFLIKLLGSRRGSLIGKQLWEIGLFHDVEKSRSAFRELQRDGYIRYEDLPLETIDGRYIDVEFVSNVYNVGGVKVIQCNIRDITERKHAEVEKAILETIEQEQRRIGQDLHDGLCQQLTGVALLAKALARKLVNASPAESAEASEIAKLINRSIDQTRDLARGLSPVEIEVAGLKTALQKFALITARAYNITCEFSDDANPKHEVRYASPLATHLFRIAQEAVSNAIQHGKAKQVLVRLTSTQESGLLTIEDNGIGFPSDYADHPGLGLRSMRYRGRMIGAKMKVARGESVGTVVSCAFPHHHRSDIKKT